MKKILLSIILLSFIFSCNNKKDRVYDNENVQPKSGGALTIALNNDLSFLNPILTSDIIDESVQDLIFPSLLETVWNEGTGVNEFKPYYANSWSFSKDGKDITFHLKNNIFWEDGNKVIPDDIRFSFNLYSNPIIASPKQFNLIYFMRDQKGSLNINKTIEVLNDSTLIFHYAKKYPYQIFHANLKFIPEHYFRNVEIKDIKNNEKNFKPLSAGPYRLEKWEENQYIILNKNPKYSQLDKPYIDSLIFKVIPEYTPKLTALKNNEVDFINAVNPEDVQNLKSNFPNINFIPLIGSYYDCINWSNIDNKYYIKTRKIKPHPLFGNKNIRKALTMAINRNEIIQAYFGNYAQLCNGPISPIFKWAYNSNVKPYAFDPNESRKILSSEGWSDSDGDGILEKDGKKFEFVLYINAGPKRKEFAATIIKDNLKKIGIDVTIEKLEFTVFENDIIQRKLDAFINSVQISSEINLNEFWNSDLRKASFNDPGFQNKRIDELLSIINGIEDVKNAAPYLYEFQEIIHDEEPCSFLYWWANIIGVNKRVQNVKSNIWDPFNHIWEWWLKN
jgi:peptide/nickel transport system substrate-binding protein